MPANQRIVALLITLTTFHFTTSAQYSQWIYPGSNGKLVYKPLAKGDKIMDFSYAGYMGGGISLPAVPVVASISALPGDNSDFIQHTIDSIAQLPLNKGFRGAVLLQPGIYNCEKTITINASGIVLRGSGSQENGTVVNMTGKPHPCINIKGNISYAVGKTSAIITDAYVPSGSLSFTVNNAAAFKTGDVIRLTRKVTDEWVQFMGMDQLVRDGKKQTWVNGEFVTDRTISAITGNTITVDVPLTDAIDAQYAGAGVTVSTVGVKDELLQSGIENLRIVSPSQSVTISEGHNQGIVVKGAADGWLRNIFISNTVNSVTIQARRFTIDNLTIQHDVPTLGSAKPADLAANGSQLLFNHCNIKGDNVFYLATGAKVGGPIVLLNCTFKGNGWIQPHQRWATGLLIDNCNVPDGGIDFMNRGSMGSGHGWAIGWAVAWNCVAESYLNQMPPGAANWVIGSRGKHRQMAIPFLKAPMQPEGLYDSDNKTVSPRSLYLAQLSERLGSEAVKNTGY